MGTPSALAFSSSFHSCAWPCPFLLLFCESFWEECDDFGVNVLRFLTCLTDILGFLEKLEWLFEQDIDDEGEEDEEREGSGEV
ncbi:hypothetical protein Tco_0156432 [Tanacetum coccineum]